MKNKTTVCLLAFLMLPMAARAQRRQISLVGTVGMATGNMERLIVNLGIEMEVFHHFYAQVSFDNFLTWDSLTGYYARDGRIWFDPAIRTRVFGMNLLGTFKLPLTQQSAWFAKAGVAYTFRSRYFYDNYYYDGFGDYGYGDYYDYYGESYSSEDENPMRTGLAYVLGTGIEYRLNKKLALTGGGTYESLFDQTPASGNNGEHGNWVKLYIGFNYRIR
ncbi:MAG: hypothetical protein NTW95_12865 [Candidatus Aminicenantes bacterium]|nr:hypothetical protein [Candidatus Aminicenantes bacterium]